MNHPILDSLLTSVPMIVVALGAMVTAFVFWHRAPLSSLLLVIACISSIALIILYPFAYEAVIRLFATDAQSVAGIRTAFAMGWSILRATYLILLVIAIYAGRKRQEDFRRPNTALEPTPTAP